MVVRSTASRGEWGTMSLFSKLALVHTLTAGVSYFLATFPTARDFNASLVFWLQLNRV